MEVLALTCIREPSCSRWKNISSCNWLHQTPSTICYKKKKKKDREIQFLWNISQIKVKAIAKAPGTVDAHAWCMPSSRHGISCSVTCHPGRDSCFPLQWRGVCCTSGMFPGLTELVGGRAGILVHRLYVLSCKHLLDIFQCTASGFYYYCRKWNEGEWIV